MQINRQISGIAFPVLLALLLNCQGNAQVIGRYGGEFMASGAGARSLAMGGAGGGISGDPWSLFFNPAGLASISQPHLGLMHAERFEGVVDYDAAVFSIPQEANRTLTVGMLRLGVNGIPFTKLENPNAPPDNSNRVEVDKYVTDGEYAFYVSRAGRIDYSASFLKVNGLEWGVAPKFIFKHIGSYRHYGLGVDAGLLKRWEGEQLYSVGLSLRDVLGTVLKSEKTGRTEVIVSTLRLGGGMTLPLPVLEADVSLAADGLYRFEALGESEALEYQAGLEYLVRKIFALRAGSDNGRFTLGGGISLKPLSIDYAFIGHDDLGDTHRISLNARWSLD